jgi:hypothetical protein
VLLKKAAPAGDVFKRAKNAGPKPILVRKLRTRMPILQVGENLVERVKEKVIHGE